MALPGTDILVEAAIAQHLRANGLPGRAIVSAVSEAAISLHVVLDDLAPYTVLVRPPAGADLPLGTIVPVRVDPDDERALIVA